MKFCTVQNNIHIQMRIKLLFLLAVLSVLPSLARNIKYTYEGHEIIYKVINESEKTVAVTKDPSYYNLKGNLVLPSTVYDGETPYTLVSIDGTAFSMCLSLKSVVIPETVTSIGARAFWQCLALESVNLPKGLTYLGGGAFNICIKLKSPMVIPAGVTKVEGSTFGNCQELTSVSLPETLYMINSGAFSGCRSLKEVNFPASLQYIDSEAFSSSGLEHVELEHVLVLGDEVFSRCSSLTSVKIGTTLEKIYDKVFEACPVLEEINVDSGNDTFTSIDGILYSKKDNCLIRCPEKKTGSIVVPGWITSTRPNAFSNCDGLTEVILPDGITAIADYAFYDCDGLTEMILPEAITTIGKYAFSNCDGLTAVTLPETLTTIDEYAFQSAGLTKIVIPDSVTLIGKYAFGLCKNLAEVTIGNSVEKIGDSAFYWCSSITEIVVPNSTKTIGRCAFEVSGIVKITLGTSVEEVELGVFVNCTSLEEIVCLAQTPPIFGGNMDISKVTLYVPDKAAYESAYGWSTAARIVQLGLTVEIAGKGLVFADNRPVASGDRFDAGMTPPTFLVLPAEGYELESLTFDEEDVMAMLQDGSFTPEPFENGSTMRVVFTPKAEATLTIRGMESHSLTHYYPEGTEARVAIVPEEGWKLHSVSFNGEDVSSSLDNDILTTPALEGDNTLEIVLLADPILGEDHIGAPKVSISTSGNTVTVTGLQDGETIAVCDTDGKVVYTGTRHQVTLPRGGVYVLRASEHTFKFMI